MAHNISLKDEINDTVLQLVQSNDTCPACIERLTPEHEDSCFAKVISALGLHANHSCLDVAVIKDMIDVGMQECQASVCSGCGEFAHTRQRLENLLCSSVIPKECIQIMRICVHQT